MSKYLYLNFQVDQVGPAKAFKEKAQASKDLGLPIDFVLLNKEYEQEENNIIYKKINNYNYYKALLRRYDLIENSIDLDKYEKVILRYPLADKSGIRFFEKHPNIITEHHTKEISEKLANIQNSSNIFLRSIQKIRLYLEKKYGNECLNNALGIIGVTKEIEVVHKHKNSITISNGIAVDSIDIKSKNNTSNQGYHLVFLLLGTLAQKWIGFDRIIESLQQYQGRSKIKIKIFGANKNETININTHQVCISNHITGAQLDSVVQTSNIAFGPLALYEKEMKEACSLKIREYCARGIPFVLANEDPDFIGNFDFLYKINNDNSIIDFDSIYEWYKALPKNIDDEMRQYAYNFLDWECKLKKMYDFAKRINTSNKI